MYFTVLARAVRVEHLGLLLLLVWVGLHGLSGAFIYGQGHPQRPIPLLVGLLLAASLLYGAAVLLVLKRPHTVRLSMVVLFALLFRAVAFTANVIQEDDFYRYIWDGQVMLQGVNPYRYAPAQVAGAMADPARHDKTDPQLERLAALLHALGPARVPATLFSRVNHPGVPTVYPPVAQGVFAFVQRFTPWSLQGLRVAMLFFDGACMLLIVLLLRHLSLPVERVLIYAWSPLVVKEFINSAHMDVIAMAAVLLTALLTLKRWWAASGAGLAVAVAAKYYPLLILPVLLRHWWLAGRRALVTGLAAFGVTLTLCALPFLDQHVSILQGLRRYAGDWSLNSGLFSALYEAGVRLTGPQHAYPLARVALVLGLVATLAVVLWRSRSRARAVDLPTMFAAAMGVAFLFSPVQVPWYLAWVIPWLCLRPSISWLVLTGLIQLYYLGFYVEYHLAEPFVTRGWYAIQAAEYLPIVGLFGWQLYRRYSRARLSASVSPAHVASGGQIMEVPI